MQLTILSLDQFTATENHVVFFQLQITFSQECYTSVETHPSMANLFYVEARAVDACTTLQLRILAQHDLLLLNATLLQNTSHLLKQLQKT